MDKKDFLEKALQLVTKERNSQHGDASEQLENTAKLWSVYLKTSIDAEQVAMCIALMKISRSTFGQFNTDDYVDLLGYGAIAGEIAFAEKAVLGGPANNFRMTLGEAELHAKHQKERADLARSFQAVIKYQRECPHCGKDVILSNLDPLDISLYFVKRHTCKHCSKYIYFTLDEHANCEMLKGGDLGKSTELLEGTVKNELTKTLEAFTRQWVCTCGTDNTLTITEKHRFYDSFCGNCMKLWRIEPKEDGFIVLNPL